MFDRVDFPAPFSPRRACTSPTAASKSTPSFATTPGNRFVIPRIATAEDGGAPWAPLPSISSVLGSAKLLAGRTPDHALHEPVHPVEAVRAAGEDPHLLALRHAQLALLVVERACELVVRPVLDLLHLLGDRGLRLRRHVRAERREPSEAVLDRAVVKAGIPGHGHRRLDAAQVVRAPVVD